MCGVLPRGTGGPLEPNVHRSVPRTLVPAIEAGRGARGDRRRAGSGWNPPVLPTQEPPRPSWPRRRRRPCAPPFRGWGAHRGPRDPGGHGSRASDEPSPRAQASRARPSGKPASKASPPNPHRSTRNRRIRCRRAENSSMKWALSPMATTRACRTRGMRGSRSSSGPSGSRVLRGWARGRSHCIAEVLDSMVGSRSCAEREPVSMRLRALFNGLSGRRRAFASGSLRPNRAGRTALAPLQI